MAIPSDDLRAIARRASRRALATRADAPAAGVHVGSHGRPPTPAPPRGPRADREVVALDALAPVPDGGELVVPPGARVTPAAEDEAHRRGVRLVTGRSAQPLGVTTRRVAVASDHGGYELKCELLEMLREMGHRPVDLGPGDARPVDYPDFAGRVAREVASGRADLGVVVDGAGIGSAMAANKVPGVLAANCWDERTARNAREHNHANVLTLGSGHLDRAGAHAVLRAFLATPAGPGRHARRADKILAIEREHARATARDRDFDPARGGEAPR